MKNWTIEVDGLSHTIGYKSGFRNYIIVDGERQKVKSSNAFINVIDYSINFGDTECKLVVIGNKVDLAVNGTFLDSNKPYVPIDSTPSWIWVLVGISTLGGVLVAGILGCLIGLLMSMLYIQFGLQKKNSAVIGWFVFCSFLQLLILFALHSLLS
ncbi:hypothetical protein BGI42_09030 [Clostridium taeniosporum]|uniref:Uncharacterized protein n=1 Tax=Clostridium taeniosporum TaxID=394958 RepID=A0A1D7XP53_9CLOT|nr:hypothetical protein BGI42_09030 [Clostridium taeniosporum]